MFANALRKPISFVMLLGSDPDDDDDVRLQKALLVTWCLMMAILAILWGIIYTLFDEPQAGSIPLGYALLSFISVAIFARTRRYIFLRTSQLLLSLLLPFLLMLALGGFVNSSSVIFWSFLCPLGALLFTTSRQATNWFLAYAALVIISGFLEPFAPGGNNLSPSMIIIFFVLNILGVSGLAFILLQYFMSQKDNAMALLHNEQQKSENLLLNILPEEIAQILKNESRVIADNFEGASILFADIVNFTPLSAEMTAVQLVALLNEIFSHFDTLVEKYGLEKIKTIGDCYMVASGVPRPRVDHAQAMTQMALEMQQYAKEREFNGRKLTFRIGINSGAVVAGVIGRKKFIYDLWGDAVNTASRMEFHGVGGQIQITESTHTLLKDDFNCESHGVVTIKGKGEMAVWNVLDKK